MLSLSTDTQLGWSMPPARWPLGWDGACGEQGALTEDQRGAGAHSRELVCGQVGNKSHGVCLAVGAPC